MGRRWTVKLTGCTFVRIIRARVWVCACKSTFESLIRKLSSFLLFSMISREEDRMKSEMNTCKIYLLQNARLDILIETDGPSQLIINSVWCKVGRVKGWRVQDTLCIIMSSVPKSAMRNYSNNTTIIVKVK